MTVITQAEVRRHPRWREQLNTPAHATPAHRLARSGILGAAIILAIAVSVAVALIWKLSASWAAPDLPY